VKLAELLRRAPPLRVAGGTDIEIASLSHDSRDVAPGGLFFALPGSKTDGNRHVKAACQAGAAAIVSELEPPPAPVSLGAVWVQVSDVALAMGRIANVFFEEPSSSLTVFGVTGTNGKTTTTYFLESIISACGGVPAVIGTIDYRLGGKTLIKAPNTTPISLELLRLLARLRDGGATHVAMEVSSHALALKRVEEVEFDAAVFTNLSRDHLDFHHTAGQYFETKARLFELLTRASSSKKRRLAVLNADDPRAPALRRRVEGARTLLFGLGPEALDLRAENIQHGLRQTRFDLSWQGRKFPARMRLVGEHNVSNALAAAAASLGLGWPMDCVLLGLERLLMVPGRLEPVDEGQDFSVFVDYAHTDAALETVLGHLKRLEHGRILTVFGCGGDRDRSKRGPMGLAACRNSDLAILTSDNPRSEDPWAILREIEEGVKTEGHKNYRMVEDRGEAIRQAVGEARAGDIVLVAGKGHEDSQIFKDRTIRFDDRETARDALRTLKR
jgi:UDP-N-acetylmuramoyl-L-alanyl-D-glutamate--2,6-diaminopimelate ligase